MNNTINILNLDEFMVKLIIAGKKTAMLVQTHRTMKQQCKKIQYWEVLISLFYDGESLCMNDSTGEFRLLSFFKIVMTFDDSAKVLMIVLLLHLMLVNNG